MSSFVIQAMDWQKRVGEFEGVALDDEAREQFLAAIDHGAVRSDHGGYLPSEMLTIGANLMGRHGVEYYRWAYRLARERWDQGLLACPFCKEPRKRT